MRSAGINKDAKRGVATACVTIGKARAAKRSAHIDTDEMCRYCAMAYDDMVMKCEPMMASMSSRVRFTRGRRHAHPTGARSSRSCRG